MSSEKKVGRVDADGSIIKNGQGLLGFLGNQKVSKFEGADPQWRGAAALLLLYPDDDTED